MRDQTLGATGPFVAMKHEIRLDENARTAGDDVAECTRAIGPSHFVGEPIESLGNWIVVVVFSWIRSGRQARDADFRIKAVLDEWIGHAVRFNSVPKRPRAIVQIEG